MTLDVRWKDSMAMAISDARWDDYDSVIQAEVSAYKNRFISSLMESVDWQLIKAIIWTESGGPDSTLWVTDPMRLGGHGSVALSVLKNGMDGADLIMSDDLANAVKMGAVNDPKTKVRAGIAYLYTRMAITQLISVRDLVDTDTYVYNVQKGDHLEAIARQVGTTVAELKRLNPPLGSAIRPNQKLKYVKARLQTSVCGWCRFTAEEVAEKYNSSIDPEYASKLNYLIKNIFPKLVRLNRF